jgi:hypothetical protein
MLKLVISLCAIALFFGTAQAKIISTLNFTSPSTTSSTVTITAGGTVDLEVDLTFDPSPQTSFGAMFFNTTEGIDVPVSSCTGVADCVEEQYLISASTLLSLGAPLLDWQTAPDQFPGEGGSVRLTALGTSSFSITYPNPGFYEIFTYGSSSNPPEEELQTAYECYTDFVNGAPTDPARCIPITGGMGSTTLETARLFVDVLPAAVPEPSYRIFLAALLGVLFVVWRRAQSTN